MYIHAYSFSCFTPVLPFNIYIYMYIYVHIHSTSRVVPWQINIFEANLVFVCTNSFFFLFVWTNPFFSFFCIRMDQRNLFDPEWSSHLWAIPLVPWLDKVQESSTGRQRAYETLNRLYGDFAATRGEKNKKNGTKSGSSRRQCWRRLYGRHELAGVY